MEMPAGGDRHLQGEVRSPGGEPGDHRGKTVYPYSLYGIRQTGWIRFLMPTLTNYEIIMPSGDAGRGRPASPGEVRCS